MVDGAIKRQGDSLAPQSVVCSAFLAADQTVTANAFTKVSLGAKTFDPYGWFDTTNFRFLPKIAGYYRVSGSVLCRGPGSPPGQVLAYVYKNGAALRRLAQQAGTANDVSGAGSTLVYCNGTTDYLELWGYTSGTIFDGAANGELTYADFELVGSSVGVAPEPWQAASLGSNWTNYGTPWDAAQFYKDPNGAVRCKGRVKNIAAWAWGAASAQLLTLPAGYRPTATRPLPCWGSDPGSSNIVFRVEVGTNGIVTLATGTPGGATGAIGGFVDLEGLHFRAEQ